MAKRKTHRVEYFEDDQRYIATIDSETNEEISRVNASKMKNTKSYFKEGDFYTVHERLNKMLKRKKDYNNLTFRLLFELLDRIEFNNRIKTFTQSELADELESHQPHVHTSLKVLENDGVIAKIQHDYYFTPKFVRYVNDGKWSELFAQVNVDPDVKEEQGKEGEENGEESNEGDSNL